jgi:acyl carrier protein
MTIDQLKQEIFCVIQESTETEVELTDDTHILNEIGLSSIETMMLISDLDQHFGINIPTTRLRDVRTVGDLCQVVIETLSN